MRVAVIGLGGLGGPAARCLAAAGTPLALFDGDQVEVHNLPRQTLFGLSDLGAPKASLAAARLRALFPGADVVAHDQRVEGDTLGLLDDCPIWVDATDQLASKLFFSDRAVELGRTLIHGGAIRFAGQVLGIVPGVGPCLRCLVDGSAEGETCQSAGILGPVVALLGTEMARMALRALKGQPIAGHYVAYDALAASLRSGVLSRRNGCATCGDVRFPRPLATAVQDGDRLSVVPALAGG
jgi:molybdopterin/thiamine biosynthesis adenylyltransferase